MAFEFKLSPEAQARRDQIRDMEASARAKFANMTDENLIASTKLYMANAEPKRWAPGEPVYDATLWHVILPELMRRVEAR